PLSLALVALRRQYLCQLRFGQGQNHLANLSPQRFAQPIRSQQTFHSAKTLCTFSHSRIPPRSDSPQDPDSFLGYRENTPFLFSTTIGPPPRLTNLEAEHRELKRQAARAGRPTFSRNFLLSAVAMVYSSQSPACFVRWTR